MTRAAFKKRRGGFRVDGGNTFRHIVEYKNDFEMKTDAKKKLAKIAAVFKALGHPTRLRIVRRLDEGECCVCGLVEETGADFSTVSQHLSVLKRVGVVEDDKRGKHVFYSLVYPCIPWLIDRMEERDSMTREQIAAMEARSRKLSAKKPAKGTAKK